MNHLRPLRSARELGRVNFLTGQESGSIPQGLPWTLPLSFHLPWCSESFGVSVTFLRPQSPVRAGSRGAQAWEPHRLAPSPGQHWPQAVFSPLCPRIYQGTLMSCLTDLFWEFYELTQGCIWLHSLMTTPILGVRRALHQQPWPSASFFGGPRTSLSPNRLHACSKCLFSTSLSVRPCLETVAMKQQAGALPSGYWFGEKKETLNTKEQIKEEGGNDKRRLMGTRVQFDRRKNFVLVGWMFIWRFLFYLGELGWLVGTTTRASHMLSTCSHWAIPPALEE
jgi:hypothetical protein